MEHWLRTTPGCPQNYSATYFLSPDAEFERKLVVGLEKAKHVGWMGNAHQLTVALGKKGMAKLGAGRISSTNQNWMTDINILMRQAKVIFVLLANRPGVNLELEMIVTQNYLSKTVFIMPPSKGVSLGSSAGSEFDPSSHWNAVSKTMKSLCVDDIPVYDPAGALFVIDESGRRVCKVMQIPRSYHDIGQVVKSLLDGQTGRGECC
jgi:hypothetical protein